MPPTISTNLIEPIVPAALRGDQLTSETGRDAAVRRHAYNARVSLARQILDCAIGIQSPSVPLNATQQAQMQNDGLSATATGSWLQVLTLDAERRVSDINYAAQLQAMTPAAVNREIVLELGATNYLLTQLLRLGIMHASTAAAHLATTSSTISRRPRPCPRRTSTDAQSISLRFEGQTSMADPAPSAPCPATPPRRRVESGKQMARVDR